MRKYVIVIVAFFLISLAVVASAETLYVDDDTEDSYSCEGSFQSIYPCSNAVDESWDGWPWYAEAYHGWTSYVYENYIIPSGINGASWTFKVQTGPNPSKVEVWYWDYSSSSWDYLYSTVHPPGVHTFTVSIPSDGLTSSPLKIKTKVQNYIEVVDYFEGKVTWISETLITSCDIDGKEKNQFEPGECVYAKGIRLESSTTYRIWIQSDPVNKGDLLTVTEDPSGFQEVITTNANGDFGPEPIWAIPSYAPPTYDKFDIVVDKLNDGGNTGKYNAASDGLDSATVVGFVAPVPEFSTIAIPVVTIFGLLFLISRRRRKR